MKLGNRSRIISYENNLPIGLPTTGIQVKNFIGSPTYVRFDKTITLILLPAY